MTRLFKVLPIKRLIGLISIVYTVFHMYRVQEADVLDYDDLIYLDAEDLAEGGFAEAYERVKPYLSSYLSALCDVEDELDATTPSYHVIVSGERHKVYGPESGPDEARISVQTSWGRAAVLFFEIVNRQLQDFDVKFYAIHGGHDLGGIFLTSEQVEQARSLIVTKSDWPYIPVMEAPWFGQPH